MCHGHIQSNRGLVAQFGPCWVVGAWNVFGSEDPRAAEAAAKAALAIQKCEIEFDGLKIAVTLHRGEALAGNGGTATVRALLVFSRTVPQLQQMRPLHRALRCGVLATSSVVESFEPNAFLTRQVDFVRFPEPPATTAAIFEIVAEDPARRLASTDWLAVGTDQKQMDVEMYALAGVQAASTAVDFYGQAFQAFLSGKFDHALSLLQADVVEDAPTQRLKALLHSRVHPYIRELRATVTPMPGDFVQ